MGEIVSNGTLVLAVPIALLAGFLSFASPCVLPLIPGYLAYIGGFAHTTERSDRRRLLIGAVLFVLGFSVVFIVFTGAAGVIGLWVVRWGDVIIRVLGGVVIVMGLVFIGHVTFLQRTVKPLWRPVTGLVGAPLLGIIFGLGWSPCLGPTLTTIIALGLTSGSAWRGALLGFAYALGLGIPFILFALGFSWVTGSVQFIKRHIAAINLIGGSLLVVIGVVMVSGLWAAATAQLVGAVTGSVSPL